MSASLRQPAARMGVVGLLVAVAAAAAAADEDREPAAQGMAASATSARQSPRTQAAPAKEASHVELERLDRSAGSRDAGKSDSAAAAASSPDKAKDTPAADVVNAFASTSWYVPPPPAKPEPPPKPTAPPLPFSFMGRYEDAAKHAGVVVMLVKGDRLYTVSEGDVIDDTYRVDRITERSVELTYLPLHTKQSLPAGGV